MAQRITDPSLLAELNTPQPITDPTLLSELNASNEPSSNFDKFVERGRAGVYNTGAGYVPGLAQISSAVAAAAPDIFGNAAPTGGFSDRYSAGVRNLEGATKDFAQRHPGAALTGNLLGAVGGGLSVDGAARSLGLSAPGRIAAQTVYNTDNALTQPNANASQVAPIAGVSAIAGGLGEGITPAVAAGKQYALAAAQKLGIPLGIAQTSESPLVRTLKNATDRLRLGNYDGNYQGDMENAIGKTIGSADGLEPTAVNTAYQNAGQTIGDISKNYDIPLMPDFANDLLDIRQHANTFGGDPEAVNSANRAVSNILANSATNGGSLPGQSYQSFRSAQGRLLSADGDKAYYAKQVRGALDDGLERVASPEDLVALKQARSQYQNNEVINTALDGNGGISLPRFANNVSREIPGFNRGYGGDIADLARVQRAFPPATNSGSPTAQNLLALGLLGGLTGGGIGTATNGAQGGGVGTGAGAVGTIGAANALNYGLSAPWVRDAAVGMQSGVLAPALARALMQQQQGVQ